MNHYKTLATLSALATRMETFTNAGTLMDSRDDGKKDTVTKTATTSLSTMKLTMDVENAAYITYPITALHMVLRRTSLASTLT